MIPEKLSIVAQESKNNRSYFKQIKKSSADELMSDMLSRTAENYTKNDKKGLLTGSSAVKAFSKNISVCDKSKLLPMYKDLNDADLRHRFCAGYICSYSEYTGRRGFDRCVELLEQGGVHFDMLKRIIMRTGISKADRSRDSIIDKLAEIYETENKIFEELIKLKEIFS